jgi:3',5'-cyclic AMP phosphodiesterase CpdA
MMTTTYPGPEALVPTARRLALVGDTQETAWVERLVGLEQNASRRVYLLNELARRKPDGVLHLGDLVAFGSSRGHWSRLDALLGPLREANIPLMPVVGNHDRMVVTKLGLAALTRRFAVLAERTWYTFRYAEVAFVALDSNLSGDPAALQLRWAEEVIAAADDDPQVNAIVGFWHHPPMSNSRIVRPSRRAREAFVPLLAKSRKGLAVFTGHAHAYEHFVVAGLHCFVSGGGGGPRHRLEVRPEYQRAPDLFAGGPLRFMHFLELEVAASALTVRVVRMADDSTHRFDTADEVTLPYRAS